MIVSRLFRALCSALAGTTNVTNSPLTASKPRPHLFGGKDTQKKSLQNILHVQCPIKIYPQIRLLLLLFLGIAFCIGSVLPGGYCAASEQSPPPQYLPGTTVQQLPMAQPRSGGKPGGDSETQEKIGWGFLQPPQKAPVKQPDGFIKISPMENHGNALPSNQASSDQTPAPPQSSTWIVHPRTGQQGFAVTVRANTQIMLAAPASGVVSRIAVHDGSEVEKGQTVLGLDCTAAEAKLAVAEAALALFEQTGLLPADAPESREGAATPPAPQPTLHTAQTHMAQAQAAEARIAVDQCTLRAPFSGRITEVKAVAGMYVQPGDFLMEVADTSAFILEGRIPVAWTEHFTPGRTLAVLLDGSAKNYQGTISRLGGKADPATGLVKIYANLDTSDPIIIHATGKAFLQPARQPKDSILDSGREK